MNSPTLNYDFSEYLARLQGIVEDGLRSYTERTGERASLRKLAKEAGQEHRYTAIYKWHKGDLHQEIRPESFSLLNSIDPQGRNPIELDAYLKGIEVESLGYADLQTHVAALSQELGTLKKQRAAMLALATA